MTYTILDHLALLAASLAVGLFGFCALAGVFFVLDELAMKKRNKKR